MDNAHAAVNAGWISVFKRSAGMGGIIGSRCRLESIAGSAAGVVAEEVEDFGQFIGGGLRRIGGARGVMEFFILL